MRKSEIFEAFVKIAEEKGLVSDYSSAKAKAELEKNPRMSALTAKDIEKLYGVKPETAKGMEYKNNIMEIAHEGNVVVSPSYDKLNGLVENNIERQNILLNIVNKNNNGLLTNHKYAEKDLILSLVSLGNHLDNANNEELRILADSCLVQVSDKPAVVKKAGFGWMAAGLTSPWTIAAGTLFAALYVQQHFNFTDEGFRRNHEKLVAELDDFLNANSDWGVGYDFSDTFKNTIVDFKSKINNFYSIYQKYEPALTQAELPKEAGEIVKMLNNPENSVVDKATEAYNALTKVYASMLTYLNDIQKNFASESYKARQIKDKGVLTSLVDKVPFLHGGQGLVADDFDDVLRALAPYKKSITDTMEAFNQAKQLKDKLQNQLAQAASETASLPGQNQTVKDVDDEAGGLDKDLEDLLKNYS